MPALRVVNTNVLGQNGLINSHQMKMLYNSVLVLNHNMISGRPQFRNRATNVIHDPYNNQELLNVLNNNNAAALNRALASSLAAEELADFIKARFNQDGLLAPNKREDTKEKFKAFLTHIIKARDKQHRARLAQKLRRADSDSTILHRINNRLRRAKREGDHVAQFAYTLRKKAFLAKQERRIRRDTTHTQQLIAWRWVYKDVLKRVFS